MNAQNVDRRTVEGFGDEWTAFDQSALDPEIHRFWFEAYFSLMPFEELRDGRIRPWLRIGPLGAARGRKSWQAALHRSVREGARRSAKASSRLPERRISSYRRGHIPLQDSSQDFGYSLGVLHHIPDTQAALASCVAKLKPGAPFLLNLYYDFENHPIWFRQLWKMSDLGRKMISRLPFLARRTACDLIAATVYFPLARAASLAEKLGADVQRWPLNAYQLSGLPDFTRCEPMPSIGSAPGSSNDSRRVRSSE